MRITHSLVNVAVALMESPTDSHWGYDLCQRSGVRSGVLYPILHRMLEEGWVSDGWEEQANQRGPARRFYRLSDAGVLALGALLADARKDRRFTAAPALGFARFGFAR